MLKRILLRELRIVVCALSLAVACEDEAPRDDIDPSETDDAGSDAARDGGASDVRTGDAADIDSSSRDATVDARTSQSTPDAHIASSNEPRDASPAAPDAARLDGAVSDASLDAAPVDASVDASAPDAQADAAPVGRVDASARDAQADAAPADGGADASTDSGPDPQCIDEGDNCDRGSCCGGLACVPEGDTGRHICGAACEIRASGCEPGCAPYCGAALTGPYRCNRAVVLGHDGTYLGIAASSPTADDSVCSSVDPYGTGQTSNSIYNEAGRYGSSTSPLSAFNQYASTPPAVVCIDDHAVIARVTKSPNLTLNPVDPEQLCEWLRGRQM